MLNEKLYNLNERRQPAMIPRTEFASPRYAISMSPDLPVATREKECPSFQRHGPAIQVSYQNSTTPVHIQPLLPPKASSESRIFRQGNQGLVKT
jgi:hypothetical protein